MRQGSRTVVCCALSAGIAGCGFGTRSVDRLGRQVPMYRGMGDHGRTVTTASPDAQRYFNQGLVWMFAFNHDEAIRSFEAATQLDSNCAMAWWGIALCHGPHINNPVVPPDRSTAAWDALQRAVALKDNGTEAERMLIEALSKRYADPPPQDRLPLDRAYADAMREVRRAHPDDADVGSLCAEAIMDLHPWDLWTKDGQPKEDTEEIVSLLEGVLRLDSRHPGANHLYIHAVEASPHPERANASADRLRNAVPLSGHLVHMPSHIDVLTGRWALASRQNEAAIRTDRRYRALSPRQDFYRFYMAHNAHMLAFSSMMEGRRATALAAAREVVNGVPADYARRNAAVVDGIMGAAYDVMKRFGRWDDLLAEPAPPDYLPITTAIWRFNRAVAMAAKGDIGGAELEREEFLRAVESVPKEAMVVINRAHHVLDIARHMLNGEIAYRKGNIDDSIESLRRAVALEDDLKYMEPPEWVQPVRHTLGAVLLSAGRFIEAEAVYREDLAKWPNNGWSLFGLGRSLRGQDLLEDAGAIEAQFRKAWSRADTPIETSCLCIPKT